MTRRILRKIALIVARLASGLLLGCMLLGSMAGQIDPHTCAVPSMLCLIFPMLWMSSFVVGVLWLLFSREKISAAVCGLALLFTLPQIYAFSPITFPDEPEVHEQKLTLLTYNVAGCEDLQDPACTYSRTISYILQANADVVCLQEFQLNIVKNNKKVTKEQFDSLYTAYPYHLAREREDVAILSKYPLTHVTGYRQRFNHFIYNLYRININGRDLSLINVHLPSYKLDDEQKQIASQLKNSPSEVLDKEKNASLYRKLRTAFEERAYAADKLTDIIDTVPGPLIVCGDFNDVPNSYAWHRIKESGLTDACSEAGMGSMITFNANYMLFHIDHVMYRPDQGMRAFNIERGDLRSSDHYPVTVRFALSPP